MGNLQGTARVLKDRVRVSGKKVRVAAIVPAYNEQENLPRVVADLKEHQPDVHIVVINDCSTDQTEAVARELGVTVLSLPINLGIGGAVQTGLKYALLHDFDITIQFDGDGQHLAEEIDKITAPILEDKADVVIGSRFLGEGEFKSSFTRRIGIGIFRFVTSALVGAKITDNTSGFRAFNARAVQFLSRYYPQDYPEPEAVIELYRNRFRLMEVPVVMQERLGGQSSIRAFKSVYYMVKVLMANFIAFTRKPVV